jgi:hypothetical protein
MIIIKATGWKKKSFFSINEPLLAFILLMQNGDNLSQILFRTLTNVGAKIQKIF